MKKTLIALLATATCAMGSDLTFATAPANQGNGGKYCGVAFTLGSADTERFTVTGDLTEQVILNTITLTERTNYDFSDSFQLYITDANNVFLGASSAYTKAVGSDEAVFTFSSSITLNTSDTYYAYIWFTSYNEVNTWVAGETVVGSGKFFTVPNVAAAGGSLTTDNASNWGLLSGQKVMASTGFAPVMSISATAIPTVPEPTTATLSLLALAGLAARRRRR